VLSSGNDYAVIMRYPLFTAPSTLTSSRSLVPNNAGNKLASLLPKLEVARGYTKNVFQQMIITRRIRFFRSMFSNLLWR